MKTSKQPPSALNEIKNIIENKICKEAMLKGHKDIAEIIKKFVPKLDNKNTHWEWGRDVTDFSSAVKEEARRYLFIQTKFPDWFRVDRKILEEQLSGEMNIHTSFSRCKYPIDEDMLEMEAMRINTIIVPGLPSINISKENVTFYYVDDPLSTQPKSRVAISIEEKIGEKLSKLLYPLYMEKFRESVFHKLLPSIENKMNEAMVKICQNKDEMDALHDLVYDKSLDNWERICLSIFFFQIDNDKFIPISKIEKDTALGYHQIRNEIKRFAKFGVLFEYKSSVGTFVGEVRLTWGGMSKFVPRLLFAILHSTQWHNIPKRQRIQFRYGLTLESLLKKIEPLTEIAIY